MTGTQVNKGYVLVLPKLKRDSDVRASDTPGKWDAQQKKAFQDVASSLDYKAPGAVKSVSSVPTMWARPLSMEMALHNPYYPIRTEMVQQWQGMLAALALAEVRRFPITAQFLDLGVERDKNPFARSLYELLPDPVNALYALDAKNPWQDVYIFLWNEKPVGLSTPSTIVAPSEEGKWDGLPWWNKLTGQLESPQPHLNVSEKALLWRWLENLQGILGNYRGEAEAIDSISGLLEEFRNSLGSRPDQRLNLSNNPQFFGVAINRGVLEGINLPVKSESQSSWVRVVPSKGKGQAKPLLIIDQEISPAWGKPPQDIWIHEEQTLASLQIQDLRNGRITWQDVEWKESKELFLEEFQFIDQDYALPGAFLPSGTKLTFQGQTITPLIPLNPILLDYFTPEDLIAKVELAQINSNDGPQVRVSLDLPLSGMKDDPRQPKNYRVSKDYPIKEENALPEVPVLEVWPNFQAEGWRSYYAFYYDAEHGEGTFQVYLPEAKEHHPFVDGRGAYQITHLEEFPSFIECQDSSRNSIGLILLKSPEKIRLGDRWKVGVDFGTSFTNIYVNSNDLSEQLNLENLHLKVTEVLTETRRPVLFEYFVPESFIPADKPLPLSSVLTTRGKPDKTQSLDFPIIDGRIYVPDRNRFEPLRGWIETDLKWKNYLPNKLFLKHLALHISAIAAKEGVQQIQWCISYPTAFSRRDKNRYAKTWQDLTEELQAQTGIRHICPEPNDVGLFKSESLAIAQYFADQEKHDLIRTTCIDMGGGTSDISVWYKNKLIHQCSVLLAGRHLLSDFLELNPNFFAQLFEQNLKEWDRLTEDKFSSKLDVFLRLESENWLKNKRDFAEDDPKFQGLLQLMAIGMGGLYYYVGIILGVLQDEGKYQTREITPVYIGGNGSRLLNWLAERGKFLPSSEVNDLLSQMLTKGSGFNDRILERTRLTQRPKDEVACGLVLGRTRLTGLDTKTEDLLIAGENCEINGESIEWRDRLEFKGNIQQLEIPKLIQLRTFLDDFHGSLKELKIEEILPLQDYELGDEPGAEPESTYNQSLWRDTERELTNVLLNMKGETDDIRVEPPFIMGLKALLKVLAKEWAGK
ncbi:MAG: hypothetical protein MGG11_01100 [Trichodesmium sp. MAG_R03]|nr:hypothetical protein [Trichodesmium sp. MAG_R03]